jgi:hypothetical protein
VQRPFCNLCVFLEKFRNSGIELEIHATLLRENNAANSIKREFPLTTLTGHNFTLLLHAEFIKPRQGNFHSVNLAARKRNLLQNTGSGCTTQNKHNIFRNLLLKLTLFNNGFCLRVKHRLLDHLNSGSAMLFCSKLEPLM